jgi:hypothetical protein
MSGSRAADDHLEGSRLEPKPVEARDGGDCSSRLAL